MTAITLLPEFEEVIKGLREPEPWTLPIRPNAARLSQEIRLIEEVDQGEALLAQLNRLPIAAMAIDTEFQFASDPVDLGRGRSWQDPTTLQPLILSGAAWIADSDTVISFAFDLRRRALVLIIERLLRLRVMFVAHFFNAEFKTLWSLGIEPVLPELYDTWVAARALTLGRGHRSIDLLAEARARANRSTSRKPIPRSPSAGRAGTASRDRHSFTRIRIPAGLPPSLATRPISSARSVDRKISNIFG